MTAPVTPADIQRLNREGQRLFRRYLALRWDSGARRLQVAYRHVWNQLQDRLRLVQDAADGALDTRMFVHDPAVLRLMDETRAALDDFSHIIRDVSRGLETNGIEAGRDLALWEVEAGGAVGFNQPSVEMIRQLVGYVDSPVFRERLAEYGNDHAQHIADIILADASLGKNPNATARHITQYLTNYPRADANAMARTVQLWSARGSQRESFRANRDIVQGWVWTAAIDSPNVCLSCVAMNGTFFSVDDILDDHYYGRCSMMPVTNSWADFGFSDGQEVPGLQSGEDWFNALDEQHQRELMGPAMFAAWQDGVFQFRAIPIQEPDDLYGKMRREKTLVELIGADAAAAYKRRPGQ